MTMHKYMLQVPCTTIMTNKRCNLIPNSYLYRITSIWEGSRGREMGEGNGRWEWGMPQNFCKYFTACLPNTKEAISTQRRGGNASPSHITLFDDAFTFNILNWHFSNRNIHIRCSMELFGEIPNHLRKFTEHVWTYNLYNSWCIALYAKMLKNLNGRMLHSRSNDFVKNNFPMPFSANHSLPGYKISTLSTDPTKHIVHRTCRFSFLIPGEVSQQWLTSNSLV